MCVFQLGKWTWPERELDRAVGSWLQRTKNIINCLHTMSRELQPPQELSVFTISWKEPRADRKNEREASSSNHKLSSGKTCQKWVTDVIILFFFLDSNEETTSYFRLLLKHCQMRRGLTHSCRSLRHSPADVPTVAHHGSDACQCHVTSCDVWVDQSGWGISNPRVVAA